MDNTEAIKQQHLKAIHKHITATGSEENDVTYGFDLDGTNEAATACATITIEAMRKAFQAATDDTLLRIKECFSDPINISKVDNSTELTELEKHGIKMFMSSNAKLIETFPAPTFEDYLNSLNRP